MSDYIFSSTSQQQGSLSNLLQSIYKVDPPEVYEFHGEWGSLALSQQHYRGFQTFEGERHTMVVIGGPVLYFRDNDFLVEGDSSVATEAIYNRWAVDINIKWDEDLSGPFTVLLVDKHNRSVTVVTDLMAFIPVYCCQKLGEFYLSTHVDALAKAAGEQDSFDQVSLADFVLDDVVTYPHTIYENILQLEPASETYFCDGALAKVASYWKPEEQNPYSTIHQAAKDLRQGITDYVCRVTEKMTEVAQFISGGEDSRALSGMLPRGLKRDAYIFLDQMNREGRIAEKVAKTYRVKFTAGFREKTHYLDILPEANALVGGGHQYTHTHSLTFDKKFNLPKYKAVFGGYLSDSLLKGAYARTKSCMSRIPFLPQFFLAGETRSTPVDNSLINGETLNKISERRLSQLSRIIKNRPITAHEWFVLYPASMRVTIPNLYSTRRLFNSYEPFMCKEAVKISAAVPTNWKLNRRLFNLAMKPYLKPSKWLFHADGRLPYFSWRLNMPIQFSVLLYRQIAKKVGVINGNQGPWGDWVSVFQDEAWDKTISEYEDYPNPLIFFKNGESIKQLLTMDKLNKTQKINLLQVLHTIKSNGNHGEPNECLSAVR